MTKCARAPRPPATRRLAATAAAALLACLIAVRAASGMETGDLATLRTAALDLLNQDRREHDLPPLALDDTLNESAQNHAEDMLRRGYYSHTSPEGETVMDRYRAAGGSSSRVVAENIARCEGCPLPPDRSTVEQLQRGWMNSPEHRRNILADGLERFGFGIAGDAGQGLYAVQNFAGAGTPRRAGGEAAGGKGDAPARRIGPEERQALALDLINRARREGGVEPLSGAPALAEAGREALDEGGGGRPLDASPFRHLTPDARTRWRNFSSVAGRCGGCGTEPTDADVRFFVGQWLDQADYRRTLLDPAHTHGGFAISADGSGGKAALMTLAGP
ncbi:CAP domain-containing protein [Skermanella rosea]|uniref:CAP domain-containing protein n=1 Tax=Skermanella rosea TaxID=1817965 RepID=UPI001931B2BF|nr:CAP domain-containing protein [Skermanella rosea]UEM01829.1 CAP domain-containing protein [Skermanella rosea]